MIFLPELRKRRRSPECSACPTVAIVDGEVHQAAAELEEQLTRVTIAFVLQDRVFDGLLCEAVLELEGSNWQAVDEQAKVEGELCFVLAVAQLTRDAEEVGRETLGGLGITR
jgi:hypothetical protein